MNKFAFALRGSPITEMDLSGKWTLSSPALKGKKIPVTLPGDNYSALINAGIIPDPYVGKNELLVQEYRKSPWVFSREFKADEALLACPKIWLEASMVDLFCDCFLNGKKAFSSSNAFAVKRPEVRKLLKKGTNRIELRFKPVEPEAAKYAATLADDYPLISSCDLPHLNTIRKVQCHGGWDWGITLAVSGVYAPLLLRGGSVCRIDALYTRQFHREKQVSVTACAELYAPAEAEEKVTFFFNGEAQSVTAHLYAGNNVICVDFEVKNPKLWWPNGYGDAHLYLLTVTAGGQRKTAEIGLRSLEVVHQPDKYGKSLFFRVNGVDVFAKGADWIPCDALPSRMTDERYENLLESARLANMNMLRCWGGGQYETESFYRWCDRKGILIWQDLMFSCSIYPCDESFLASVREELEYQVRRLRGHASLAMWCGDNELLGAVRWHGAENEKRYLVYFDRLNRELTRTVERLDPDRMFWPTSPCGGPGDLGNNWRNDTCGDMHFWDVWNEGKNFEAYYTVKPRFCSEFGYQAFPSAEAVHTYCPDPAEQNIFSSTMDHHQKCSHGNAPIIGMMAKNFMMPKGFDDFFYLSQVQQALAIKTGVEYWRTLKPRCMGTLFWQFNDNWPVASWSSVEYSGKWKQLNYHAKRFYQPVIGVMFRNPENELNELWAVSDLAKATGVKCTVTVLDFAGKTVDTIRFQEKLEAGESRRLAAWSDAELAKYPAESTFLVIGTTAKDVPAHGNVFFRAPFKKLPLRQSEAKFSVLEEQGKLSVVLSTNVPLFFVTLDTPGIPGVFSDNSFTLLPGKPVTLEFTPWNKPVRAAKLRKALTIDHLRKSY